MNKILTITRSSIPYVKELRNLPHVESIAACVLMQQLDFRFDSKPNGFYKFLEPCDLNNNPLYKVGDSWKEELGMSPQEFRTAFDQIGVRYNSKTEFDAEEDKFKDKYYCSYHDKLSRITYYFRNHELTDSKLDSLVSPTGLKTAGYETVDGGIQACRPGTTGLKTDITDNTQIQHTDTTSNKSEPKKIVLSDRVQEFEDAAYCLFLDWQTMAEKSHITWDIKGWRAKRIIKWLKNGYTFDDLRLAVRGMLTDDFLQKQLIDDIDWLCKDESSRIELYKNRALKKGIKSDEAIRKSDGYKRVSSNTTPKRDFARKRI